MDARLAATPDPPYWAVIFSSHRTGAEAERYARTAEAMVQLAARQPGFLGVESARDAEGFGITVSYWASAEAIAAWKQEAAHLAAQRAGHETFYADFVTRVARVERAYTLAGSPRTGL